MIQVFNNTQGHWKPARSTPERITKGKHKGKYRVMVFTGNPEHPQGLSSIIATQDEIREVEREEFTPPTEIFQTQTIEELQHYRVIKLLDAAQRAVKFGNGIQQTELSLDRKKANERAARSHLSARPWMTIPKQGSLF